jgi:hypothetical protein
MPAQAGIQPLAKELGPRFRGDERNNSSLRASHGRLRSRRAGAHPPLRARRLRRLIPPGWERGLTPAQIAAQRREIAKWERAFETPLARRLRKQQEEEQARLEAEQQEEIEREVLAMKAELASMRAELIRDELRWKAEVAERKRKADLAWERFIAAFKRGDFRGKANFNPDQPRDELGRWTDAGGASADAGAEQDLQQQSPGLPTAMSQEQRDDLSRLQAIANNPPIRSQIDQAWSASNPSGSTPREHGFWISRNEETGELFTRPFANPGTTVRITPGPTPSDAIAFFHTHPNLQGYSPGPSFGDRGFAADVGLPGILQSHNGMYYFGPQLRQPPRR